MKITNGFDDKLFDLYILFENKSDLILACLVTLLIVK